MRAQTPRSPLVRSRSAPLVCVLEYVCVCVCARARVCVCVCCCARAAVSRYVYCGELAYRGHDPARIPIRFVWELRDFESVKSKPAFRQLSLSLFLSQYPREGFKASPVTLSG
eukprot:COSAG03_NODE_3112_length_2209_cov_2.446445_1_plen_113_part_00